MSKHPIGTLVREDHAPDETYPGASVWCRIAEWCAVRRDRTTTYGWTCISSSAAGNVLFTVWDGEAASDVIPFDELPVVGVIPGSEAQRQRDLLAQVCACGCPFARHRLLVPPAASSCAACSDCDGFTEGDTCHHLRAALTERIADRLRAEGFDGRSRQDEEQERAQVAADVVVDLLGMPPYETQAELRALIQYTGEPTPS